jgi:uracil phosphoribosyltransferase
VRSSRFAILRLTEASKNWPTRAIEINTPLAAMQGAGLALPVVFAPILRAGLGLLEGMLRVMPDAEIGHIGLYRDEVTLRPVNYYCRLPARLAESQVVLLDPMLATGRSATEVATLLKAQARPIFNVSARSESNNCEACTQISRSTAPQSIPS